MRLKGVFFNQFPSLSSQPARQRKWLTEPRLEEQQMLDHHQACSLHFPNGDALQVPSIVLGRCFASPNKEKQSVWFESTEDSMPATISTVLHYSNAPEDTVLLYTTVVNEVAYLECSKQ